MSLPVPSLAVETPFDSTARTGSSGEGITTSRKAMIAEAKAAARELKKAEKRDPTEEPEPLIIEKVLSARLDIGGIGTGGRYGKFLAKQESARSARQESNRQESHRTNSSDGQTRAALAREKMAEAKALAKLEREQPSEEPVPLLVERAIGARIQPLGTAARYERFQVAQEAQTNNELIDLTEAASEEEAQASAAEEKARAEALAADESAVTVQVDRRKDAAVAVQAAHRGRSVRRRSESLSESRGESPLRMPEHAKQSKVTAPSPEATVTPPADVGASVNAFFSWVGMLGQAQAAQAAPSRGEVRQQL